MKREYAVIRSHTTPDWKYPLGWSESLNHIITLANKRMNELQKVLPKEELYFTIE